MGWHGVTGRVIGGPFQLFGGEPLAGIPRIWIVAIGCLLAISAGVLSRYVRELYLSRQQGNASDSPTASRKSTPTAAESPIGEPKDTEPQPRFLVEATGCIDDGKPSTGIQLAYRGYRATLAESYNLPNEGTHWEFVDRFRAADVDAESSTLQELTELYERAVFGATPPSETEALRAIQSVTEHLNREGLDKR